MAHPKGGRDKTSDWVELEEKVDDQIGPYGGRAKTMTVMLPGKGKKGKAKQVKLRIPPSMIPELKRQVFAAFWDTQELKTPTDDATASRYMVLDDISLGTGSANRLGDAIYVDRLVVRIMVKPRFDVSYVTTGTASVANFLVVMDTEPDATVPAWTDMFATIGAGSVALYDVAVPEPDKRFRFRYLREVRAPLEWTAAYWDVTNSRAVAQMKPICITLDIPIRRRVMYDSSVAKPVKGFNLGIFGWSDLSNSVRAWGSYEVFFRDA